MYPKTYTTGESESRTHTKQSQVKQLGNMESELRTLNKQAVSLHQTPEDKKHIESKIESVVDEYRKLRRTIELEEASEGHEYVP